MPISGSEYSLKSNSPDVPHSRIIKKAGNSDNVIYGNDVRDLVLQLNVKKSRQVRHKQVSSNVVTSRKPIKMIMSPCKSQSREQLLKF